MTLRFDAEPVRGPVQGHRTWQSRGSEVDTPCTLQTAELVECLMQCDDDQPGVRNTRRRTEH